MKLKALGSVETSVLGLLDMKILGYFETSGSGLICLKMKALESLETSRPRLLDLMKALGSFETSREDCLTLRQRRWVIRNVGTRTA